MLRRTLNWLALVLLAVPVAAGEFNPLLDVGDEAPVWKDLPGVDGKSHSLEGLKGNDVVVVVFTCNSCPYAVDYEDRIIALAKKHAADDSRVAVVAINVNKVEEDSLPRMKERARDKGFPFPYLYDETQEVARKYGAGYTPEFFVLDKGRRIVYMGAMDDNTDASKAGVNYVELAVDAALKGGRPKTTETVAIGCRIRFERTRTKKPR